MGSIVPTWFIAPFIKRYFLSAYYLALEFKMSADEEESRLVIDVDDPSTAEAEEMQVDVVNVSIQDENSNRGLGLIWLHNKLY